jgi:hypothetical protein
LCPRGNPAVQWSARLLSVLFLLLRYKEVTHDFHELRLCRRMHLLLLLPFILLLKQSAAAEEEKGTSSTLLCW